MLTDHVDEEALKEREQAKPGLLCVSVVEVVSLLMSMASLNLPDCIYFLLSPLFHSEERVCAERWARRSPKVKLTAGPL